MDVLILLLLILLNGLFALSELAVVSSRKVRLQQWADEGDRGAAAALRLAEQPTRFLSTIQIGITSIGILSGVFGEAAIAARLATWLQAVPLLAPYAGPLSVGVMVVLITVLSLIFGELVPKRLAMHNPERLATLVALPMTALSRMVSPLVHALSVVTDALLRLIGAHRHKEPSITEEEIRVLMEQGTDEGVFDRAEQELVENIFRLDDRKVVSVMTPRNDIVWLDLDDELAHNHALLRQHPYTHFPVYRGSSDEVVGFVDTKPLLDRLLAGDGGDFAPLIRPALYIPANVSLMQLLEQFKAKRTHIALVVDEYGELHGLVTLNDVLESIVGDLPQWTGGDDEIVRRDDGSYLVDGTVTLDDFRDYFELSAHLPGEDDGNIQTLGGVMMHSLGRIPQTADRVEWQDFQFEIVDMDRTRVDKVLVVRRPPRHAD